MWRSFGLNESTPPIGFGETAGLHAQDTGSHATSEFWCPDEAVTAITEPTALAPAAAAPEVPPFQETRSQQAGGLAKPWAKMEGKVVRGCENIEGNA